MSYLPDTVLTRNKAKGNELDVVKVVGVSPIKEASLAEWEGSTGEHLIVQPHEEFGASQIVPLTVLQSEYKITEVPEQGEVPTNALGTGPSQVDQRLTPEQQFANATREDTSGKKPKQAKPEVVTS